MLAHSMPAQQHVSTASVMYDTFKPWPSSVVMIVEPDFCQPSAKTCIGAAVDDEGFPAMSAVAMACLSTSCSGARSYGAGRAKLNAKEGCRRTTRTNYGKSNDRKFGRAHPIVDQRLSFCCYARIRGLATTRSVASGSSNTHGILCSIAMTFQ